MEQVGQERTATDVSAVTVARTNTQVLAQVQVRHEATGDTTEQAIHIAGTQACIAQGANRCLGRKLDGIALWSDIAKVGLGNPDYCGRAA
ncbi:hypothetical protein D9M68_608350 [compost metagenome]